MNSITTEKTPSDMIIREAVLNDHDDILKITKDENLYDGRDYLPYCLQDWLEDGIDQNSNRRNLVFLLTGENQIIGFRSIYLQNGGRVVACFARRIYKDMRGKGFGRRLSELTTEYLKSNYPLVAHTILLIGNLDLADDEYNDPKHGKRLTEGACKIFQLTMKTVNGLAMQYAESSSTSQSKPEDGVGNHFKLLTKDEYKQVLRNKDFISAALVNDTILLNLVPVIVKTEGDFEFAAMNSQYVLLEGSVQNPIALSIFTCQLPSTDGRLRTKLDYFTIISDSGRSSVVEHVAKQLIHYKRNNDKTKKQNITAVDGMKMKKTK